MLIELFICFEAYTKRSLERKIEEKFEDLEDMLEKSFSLSIEDSSEVKCLFYSFILKFFIIFVVRTLHTVFGAIPLSIALMFTEFVTTASDYAFTLKVNLLKVYVKKYCSEISPNNIKQLEMDKNLTKFYEMSQLILRRYSISLLLNITSNSSLLSFPFAGFSSGLHLDD